MAAIALTAAPARGQGCPTRHFYNHSAVYFTVQFPSAQGSCSVDSSGNRNECVIPPGGSAELHYPSFVLYRTTTIQIASQINPPPVYPAKTFTIDWDCEVLHGGNTGNIVVNEPTRGDIQTCGRNSGGTYDCQR